VDLAKKYKEKTNFKNEEDISKSLANIFMFGTIKSDYKSSSVIKKKEELNELIINLLEEILSNDSLNTKKEKLEIINLLDELNFRNEILQMMEKKNVSDIKKASKRIGKKFMSSIE
jgi:hypothetical protein